MGKYASNNQTRCSACGFRMPAGVGTCLACGVGVTTRRPPLLRTENAYASTGASALRMFDPLATRRTGMANGNDISAGPANIPAVSGSASPATSRESARPVGAVEPAQSVASRADVTGRVIAVEHSHTEPRSFDIYRVLTKALWFLALLPVIVVVGGLCLALKCFSGMDLLWLGYFFRGNGRAAEQIPVWYARVRREDDGAEVMVRIKGYASGNVAADDLMDFWGKWRDGVLVAKSGFNQRTRALITFHRSVWPVLFMLTLAMFIGLAICLHAAAHSVNHVPQTRTNR